MTLEPWWIIIVGDQNSSGISSPISIDYFYEEITDIFSGWTQFSLKQDPQKFRWFLIDRFQEEAGDDLISQILNFLDLFSPFSYHRENNPTQPTLTVEELHAIDISIALIGDVRSPVVQTFYHLLGKVIRLRRERLFPGRNLKNYGFLYIPQELPNFEHTMRTSCLSFLIQLNTMQNDLPLAERPFNNVVIIQDKNADETNPEGYVNLSEEKIPHLIAQMILHLLISNARIIEGNRTAPDNCWTQLGSVALYFDQHHYLTNLASKVGNSLLDNFKNNEGKPWVDKKTVQAVLSEKRFQDEISIKNLFKKIINTSDLPSFNFSSKIWAYPDKTHPYKFWTPLILKLYFGFYVKFLPVRLVEYGRLFLSRSFQDFQRYLERVKKRILEGSEEVTGLKSYIQDITEYPWKHQLLACGLKQYENTLMTIRDIIAHQRNYLKSELFHLEEFSNLMVFPIPRFLKSFYENANDEFTIEEEKKIVQDLQFILSSHPLPLALFVRALLLGIVLFFLFNPFLNWISPLIINLEWLVSNALLLAVISFGFPFLIAIWRYQVKTLRWTRKLVKKYIASILRHAQSRVREKIVQMLDDLYSELDEFCRKLQEDAQVIREQWQFQAVPDSPMRATDFQISLTGSIDNSPVLMELPQYEISRFQRTLDRIEREEQADLMRAALCSLPSTASPQNADYLWQYILQKNFNEANRMLIVFCLSLFQENKDLFYWLRNSANPKLGAKLLAWAYPSGVLRHLINLTDPQYEYHSLQDYTFSMQRQNIRYFQIDIPNYLSIASIRYLENLASWFWGSNFQEQSDIINQLFKTRSSTLKATLALHNDNQRAALFQLDNQKFYAPDDLEMEVIQYREKLMKTILQ